MPTLNFNSADVKTWLEGLDSTAAASAANDFNTNYYNAWNNNFNVGSVWNTLFGNLKSYHKQQMVNGLNYLSAGLADVDCHGSMIEVDIVDTNSGTPYEIWVHIETDMKRTVTGFYYVSLHVRFYNKP